MTIEAGEPGRLERQLATILQYGTWVASAVIAAGLLLTAAGAHLGPRTGAVAVETRVIASGIALLILLPVIRVGAMLIVFLRERDYRFGAIAALVLAIVLLGFALGALSAAPI